MPKVTIAKIWCRNAACMAVWDNDGDTLFLTNAKVLMYSYGK